MKFVTVWFVLMFCRFDHWLCRTLPGAIRYQWAKLWVREDEFHPSLDSHAHYVHKLPSRQRDLYWQNLMSRRGVAHKRDLAKTT